MDEKFEQDVEKFIYYDSHEFFISFLKSHSEILGQTNCLVIQSKLLKLICLHRAVKCATALLKEETGLSVDLNVALEGELLPLQLAAQSLSFDLTQLFWKHGAEVNVFDIYGSRDLAMLPLSLALKAICRDKNLSDWTPEKSVFKLIYVLCLKDSQEALDTINLLAVKTKDVEKVGLRCVEEGEVIQFAALVMAALDILIPPSFKHAEENLIGRHLWGQIGVINNQELRTLITRGPKCEVLDSLKNKKINLLMQWKLLKILEIGGEYIEEYCTLETTPNHLVPYGVARILYEKANMVLMPDDVYSDDIECLRPKLKPKEKARLNEGINNYLRSASVAPKLQTQDEDCANESLGKKRQIESMRPTVIWEKSPAYCSSSSSPSICCPPSRAYHTCRALNFNFGKHVTSLLPRVLHQKARPSFSLFLPSTQICARLFLTAKRSLK